MSARKKAFTLVELLVVIAIIGLLATLTVVVLNSARSKARDTKRLADIRQITTALEMFYDDVGRYPNDEEWEAALNSGFLSYNGKLYLSPIPTAARPPDGACTEETNTFAYNPLSEGSSYLLSYCLGSATESIEAGGVCIGPAGMSSCSECGYNIYDPRGGGPYPTVLIGEQCWMAENLNVGTRVDSLNVSPCVNLINVGYSCQTDPETIEKYCYNNTASYCLANGGLYEWAETMALPYDCNKAETTDIEENNYIIHCPDSGDHTITPKHQGICPEGWHIPTMTEIETLTGLDTETGGDKMKSAPPTWNGSNAYGFSAIPSKNRQFGSSFSTLNEFYIWLTTHSDSIGSYFLYLLSDSPDIGHNAHVRVFGFSVRCIKD